LLLPLLKSERNHEQREQSLLERIREKDNVLFKILDKIDPSQLTSMFPGTAGVRHTKPKTSDLIRHIKGATRFDEKDWRGSPADEDNLANGLADSVYAHGGFTSVDSARIRDATWWKSLDDVDDTRSPSPERPQTATKKKEISSRGRAASEEQVAADEDMSTEDEDEFQVRNTLFIRFRYFLANPYTYSVKRRRHISSGKRNKKPKSRPKTTNVISPPSQIKMPSRMMDWIA
jgi:hypothetical protein